MTAYERITVSPIAGALGAEIGSVDIAAGVDDATIAEIRRALLEHLVIFFRDQQLDDASHKAFSRRFGELFIHPNYDFGRPSARSCALCALPATSASSARNGTPIRR